MSENVQNPLPFVTYSCLKFPDCGWVAVNNVPESVVRPTVREVTVEVEYYWINPGVDGWMICRSNGPGGVEQFSGNDINTHKDFFRANQWATWTLHLQNAHFGSRADGTDLLLFFGADPDDECYVRSVKVYETATPENFAAFSAAELQATSALELNMEHRHTGLWAFDLLKRRQADLPGLNHWHNGMEVLLCRSEGEITVNGEALSFGTNDLIFINPDQIRTLNGEITGAYYYLEFDLSTLEPPFQSPLITGLRTKRLQFQNFVPASHPAHPALKGLYRELIEVSAMESAYKELRLRALLLQLLFLCAEAGLVVENRQLGARKMEYIRNAIVYMESHLAEPITVGEVAAYVHLSEAYFSRHFKACMGAAPLEHLNHMRVDRAAERLLAGASVTEAAVEVGIPNVGHFIRQFKKYHGQTPYRWQKTQGK